MSAMLRFAMFLHAGASLISPPMPPKASPMTITAPRLCGNLRSRVQRLFNVLPRFHDICDPSGNGIGEAVSFATITAPSHLPKLRECPTVPEDVQMPQGGVWPGAISRAILPLKGGDVPA